MKIVKKLFIALLLVGSSALFAQQESTFSFYRYQMNLVNPAYAGAEDKTVIASGIRNQWSGIENAPESKSATFGIPVGKNIGLGISAVWDKTFIERSTFLGIDASYKVKVTENTQLYLGVKAGGNFYDVNTTGLNTYNVVGDPALRSINTFNPNIGFGALVKHKKFFMSLSIPRVLDTERAKNIDGYAAVATDKPHVYFSSGYDFNLNSTETLVLKPSFFLRYVNNAPVSIDFNTVLNVDDLVEFGGTYRSDKAFSGMVNFKISKKLIIGYVYEVSTRVELARARNTSELLLRYEL